jgi:hypothetical protein
VVAATALGFGGAQWYRHNAAPAPGLHFDNRALSFPGQAEMHALTGSAWTPNPTTEIDVHVVNDGTTTLRLFGGSLSGSGFTGGTLTPDSSTLAPGQAGSLHGKVTLRCFSDAAEHPTEGLAATVMTMTDGDIPRAVRLTTGGARIDGQIVTHLCHGIRSAADVSTQVVTSNGATVVQATLHNITGQPIAVSLASISQSITGKDPSHFETIPAGASITLTLTTDESCDTTMSSDGIGSYDVFVKTLTGGYRMQTQEWLPQDPRLSTVCR